MGVVFAGYDNIDYLGETLEDLGLSSDEANDELYEEGICELFAYREFHRSTRGLKHHKRVSTEGWSKGKFIARGYYRIGECTAYSEFSYSSYGSWRESLAQEILNESAQKIWKSPKKYKDDPFFELIHFADNVGAIGWKAARDLHEDFQTFRDKYIKSVYKKYNGGHTNEWFVEKYDEMTEITKIAADHGCIRLS